MMKCLLALVAAGIALAQSPADLFEKAPPSVDEALRARVREFYQLHVEGKFRPAEQFVAEDTKDFFYAANKPKYLNFEIKSIRYSDNFTRAIATMVCEMFVPVIGFMDRPVKVPHASAWKLVDGQWYWYVDQEAAKATPFGKMQTGGTGGRALPANIGDIAATVGQGVQVDKPAVELKGAERSSATVTVANVLPGMITLQVEPSRVPGLKWALERQQIGAGGKGLLKIEWTPGSPVPPQPVTAVIRVEQTNQQLPVTISFQK